MAHKKDDQSIRQARHERKEAKRRARKEARQQQPPARVRAAFKTQFGAGVLQGCGPQILCTWSVPNADAEALRKAGRPVPFPVQGAILVDTGATRTCIAQKTADDLGLQPKRLQPGFGAGGKHINPVFLARLDITITDPQAKITHGFSWEQEVEGIQELHNFAAPITWNGQIMIVTGLLGRDILRHAKISYDGPGGVMRFEFDIATIQGAQPSR